MDQGHTNIVIVPSRGRPHNVERCFTHLKQVSHISDFIMVINEDQKDLYPKIDDVKTIIVPAHLPTSNAQKLNYIVDEKLYLGYETLSFIDDDCIVTTDGWDLYLALPLKAKGYGVAWGNDTIQNGRVPTKGMITTNILDSLGYLCPPQIIHLFTDDFLARLGQELNSAHYAPDVMMEHHHWLNKKAPMDETYQESASREVWDHDEEVFTEFMTGRFHDDLEKLKKDLKIA